MESLKTKLGFLVIEDDGGGLTLCVTRGTRVIWAHTGYEYCPGQLIADMRALWAGRDPIGEGWENGENDPQAMYDVLKSYPWGWKIVATDISVSPKCMGAAARAEILDRLTADERARLLGRQNI